MAVVPICSLVPYKDQAHTSMKVITKCERSLTDDWLPFQKVFRYLSPSVVGYSGRRSHVLHFGPRLLLKENKKQQFDAFCMVHNMRSTPFKNSIGVPLFKHRISENAKSRSRSAFLRDEHCSETYALEIGTNEKQLKVLDSYFSKLHDDIDEQHSPCMSNSNSGTVPDREGYQMEGTLMEIPDKSGQHKTKSGLGLLESYFGKVTTGYGTKRSTSSTSDEEVSERNPMRISNSAIGEYDEKERTMEDSKSFMGIESMDDKTSPVLFGNESIQDLQTSDEASDFSLISILAAINIAVFLFEIASPIRNSDVEHLSLPLIYGAKINKLILVGEWWRLVTPMFLVQDWVSCYRHSGLPHVALGCWMLLTFGPQVCQGYGPFTFFLIYILGGICGNLTSFIHTPELTVCGTGPVFAIIGAWLIYQVQNKGVIAKEVTESMFWKAVIATALTFVLSNFGRIDDWTHLGATFSGLMFGFITCPTLQLNDGSSKNGQKEGIALVQRQADPRKSLATFTLFILILSSLAFFYEPQLESLELDGFL